MGQPDAVLPKSGQGQSGSGFVRFRQSLLTETRGLVPLSLNVVCPLIGAIGWDNA